MPASFRGKICNLYILENKFNAIEEFKIRSYSKKAFVGSGAWESNLRWLVWQINHPDIDSLKFLQSAASDGLELQTPIFSASGRRADRVPVAVSDTAEIDDEEDADGKSAAADSK